MTIQMSGYHVVSCPTRKHQTKKHITLISTSLIVLPNEASPSYTERDIGSLETGQILILSLHYTRFRYQAISLTLRLSAFIPNAVGRSDVPTTPRLQTLFQ